MNTTLRVLSALLRYPDEAVQQAAPVFSALLAEDDGPAPLSVADHLAALGHEVTLIVQTNGVAPLVGKYSIGTMLARLVDGGVRVVPIARATAIDGPTIHLASTYGTRWWSEGLLE